MSTAVLFATAPSSIGGSAAALPWEGSTLLARLIAQLADLGVGEVHVISRPAWIGELEHVLDEPATGVRMHCSDNRQGDLRAFAAIASAAAAGAVVVANAETLTQGEALAGLLADPRVATGILTTTRSVSRVVAFRTRARRGSVISASMPYHVINQPNGSFLGVLKIGDGDRAAAADVAERLAELLDGPLPESWSEEFEAKLARWTLTLHRRGADHAAGDEAPQDPDEDGEDEDDELPGDVVLAPKEEAELRRRVAAAEQDVTALVLYGLVRSAVRVNTSHLRRLFWARPLSPEDVARAAARIDDHDEERALLESSVKANDGFFTTFFVSPYSKYIARWAARRGWTPNQVSTVSVLAGFLSAAAFATGERTGLVVGAVLLQVAFTLDCVDGQLARYTRTFTAFGAWLDSIFDRTKEYAVFAGLALGAAREGDDVWLLAGAALTLQVVRHMMDFSFNIAQDQAMLPAVPRPLADPPHAKAAAALSPARPVESPPGRQVARSGVSAGVRKLESSRAGVWLRKLVAFPIGERFAVISIAAALFDARVTFVSLLVLGGCAAMYSGGGRVLRSLGRRGHAARFTSAVAGAGAHAVMRDDGPLAQWLGSLVGRRVPIGAVALVALGAAPLLVAASSGDDASWTAATAVVVWAVVVCGVSSGRPLTGRLRWAVIPILRVIEYGSILWLAALAGSAALPAAFAFLCAITFRHYDAYYRWRQRGDPPGRWVVVAALGWDGRLIAVLGMAAAAVAATGLYVAAALLGSLLVGESVASWIAHRRNEDLRPLHDDEDEDAA